MGFGKNAGRSTALAAISCATRCRRMALETTRMMSQQRGAVRPHSTSVKVELRSCMSDSGSVFVKGCRRLVVLVTALATLSLACRGGAPATSAKPVSADTWAVVDGREITRERVGNASRRARDSSQTLSYEEEMAAKLSLLNDLIVQDLLLAKAGTLKVELPDTELDTAYANAQKNIAADAFQQELTRRGLTAADMREGLRRELLSQKVIDREV